MSAWGLLAAPFFAHAPAPSASIEAPAAVQTAASESGDAFSDLAMLDEMEMRDAAGGADYSVTIDDIASNHSETSVGQNNAVTNGNTGQISNNVVSGNGGLTTVFNNTGNGVVFQSNVNVNIFLDQAPN